MKKKILFVTTSRADYGVCKNLIYLFQSSKKIKFYLIVSGTHLKENFGNTIREIKNNKIKIYKKINILGEKKNNHFDDLVVAKNTFKYFIKTFKKINPDFIIIFGDRYEMLPLAYLAYLNRTKIIHINGGEVSYGAIDESIRHSITKFSDYHFVSNEINKTRVIQMGENPKNVYNYGSLSIDAIKKIKFLNRKQIEKKLKYKLFKKNLVFTYHPETYQKKKHSLDINLILNTLKNYKDIRFFITSPNFDKGSMEIKKVIKNFVKKNSNFIFFDSLGFENYMSLVNLSDGVIGNSSSGIIEIPSLKKGTINIGKRQLGRSRSRSIIDCELNSTSIKRSIKQIYSKSFQKKILKIKNVYEKKNTTYKIYLRIMKLIKKKSTIKQFYLKDEIIKNHT